jgi:hypothetical protein
MFELDKGLGESERFADYFSLKAERRDTEARRLLHWACDEGMNPSNALQDAMAVFNLGQPSTGSAVNTEITARC